MARGSQAPEYDPNAPVYVRNEEGGVQAVTQAHYDKYCTTRTNAGNVYPLPGWSVITEAEARKAEPRLFGHSDPRVRFTAREAKERWEQQQHLETLRKAELAELGAPGE